MTYRLSTLNWLILLLAWMLFVTAACGLIFLGAHSEPGSAPRRTRPPLVIQP